MMVYRGVSAQQVVLDEGLTQIHDVKHLDAWVEEVLAASPEEVERFQAGEHRLQGYFMGKIMKASRGKADPGEVSRLLLQKLEVRSPR